MEANGNTHPAPDFRRLFESAPGLYLVLQPDLTIVAASDAYLKATMTERQAIVGRGLFEVFPDNPSDPTATGVSNLKASLDRVITQKAPDTMAVQKYDIARPEAEGGGFEERHWSPKNVPVLGDSGELLFIIHRVEDVTEFVRLQSERATERRSAEALKHRVVGLEAEMFLRARELQEANEELRVAKDLLAQEERAKRARAEASEAESRERYRQLVEIAPDAVFIECGGTFTYANPAALRLFGARGPEELIGTSIFDRIHPDDHTSARERLEHLREGQSAPLMERRYIRLDGSVVDAEVTAAPIGEDGRGGSQVIARDITERRRLEEQLRQSQKMDAIGQLAGGVAHDFNNLLTAILGHSQLMQGRLKSDDPARRDLQGIEKAALRASGLTRQLLAFSRQQVLQPRVLDLNALVTDMDRMLRRLIGADIDLVTAPETALGHIKADPGQLEQVLLNLIVNARDAMPEGGQLTIETDNVELDDVYARARVDLTPGRYVMLAVSDTGCGMDAVTRSRMFEPFFTTKEVGRGTGLGLSTVHGIVKQSGGHIEVYSEVGHGTTFKVYLPRVDEAAERIERHVAAPPERGTETILLVEDEELVRAIVQQTLQAYGYTVLVAEDGEEALHMCERRELPIDLVSTDVVMPKMGGPTLAESLGILQPDLKVLYMSGYTHRAVARQGLSIPGTAYLQKPFTPDALLRKVREVLDGRQRAAA